MRVLSRSASGQRAQGMLHCARRRGVLAKRPRSCRRGKVGEARDSGGGACGGSAARGLGATRLTEERAAQKQACPQIKTRARAAGLTGTGAVRDSGQIGRPRARWPARHLERTTVATAGACGSTTREELGRSSTTRPRGRLRTENHLQRASPLTEQDGPPTGPGTGRRASRATPDSSGNVAARRDRGREHREGIQSGADLRRRRRALRAQRAARGGVCESRAARDARRARPGRAQAHAKGLVQPRAGFGVAQPEVDDFERWASKLLALNIEKKKTSRKIDPAR